jgi:hypothetical protein
MAKAASSCSSSEAVEWSDEQSKVTALGALFLWFLELFMGEREDSRPLDVGSFLDFEDLFCAVGRGCRGVFLGKMRILESCLVNAKVPVILLILCVLKCLSRSLDLMLSGFCFVDEMVLFCGKAKMAANRYVVEFSGHCEAKKSFTYWSTL